MDQIRVGQAHIAIVPEGATPQGPMISACPRGRRAFPFPAGRSPAFFPTSHKKRTGYGLEQGMAHPAGADITRPSTRLLGEQHEGVEGTVSPLTILQVPRAPNRNSRIRRRLQDTALLIN